MSGFELQGQNVAKIDEVGIRTSDLRFRKHLGTLAYQLRHCLGRSSVHYVLGTRAFGQNLTKAFECFLTYP